LGLRYANFPNKNSLKTVALLWMPQKILTMGQFFKICSTDYFRNRIFYVCLEMCSLKSNPRCKKPLFGLTKPATLVKQDAKNIHKTPPPF
jgi:hypothetical protein